MPSEPPLISIVTVAYNDRAALEATIRSLEGQLSDRVEYLVIDGGSSDGTLEMLQGQTTGVTHWISEPDGGIYQAFNKGVTLAYGTWMLFLGAGDLLYGPAGLAAAIEILDSAPLEVQIAYGRVATFNADGSLVEEENGAWSTMKDRWTGGRKMMPHHQGIFQRKSFLLAHPFDEGYRIVADYKAFMLAAAAHPPLYIDAVIAKVFVGGVSTAPRTSLASVLEILRLNRELGFSRDHVGHQIFFLLKCITKTGLSYVLPTRTTMQIIDAYRLATRRRKKWT